MTESKWDHQLYKEPMAWLYGPAKLNPFTVNTAALFFLIWKPNLALQETKKLFTHKPSTKHHGATDKRMSVKKSEARTVFENTSQLQQFLMEWKIKKWDIFREFSSMWPIFDTTTTDYRSSCTFWCNCTLDENKGEEQHHFGTLWIAKL